MDYTYFVFATYVFLLVCACIWLFSKLIRANKNSKKAQENKPGNEREQKLFMLYQNIEDMLNSFEEYVEETKSETAKSAEQVAEMLEETKKLAAEIKEMQHKQSDCSLKTTAEKPVATVKNAAVYPAAVYKNTAQLAKDDLSVTHNDIQDELFAQTDEHLDLHKNHVTSITEPIDILPRQMPERKNLRTNDRVALLMDRGLDKNEIARQLGISIREVTLAMKVRKAGEVK